MAMHDVHEISFSADGHLFQVEYAAKAVEKEPIVVAVRCADGTVFAASKAVPTALMTPNANRRIFAISAGIAAAVVGYRPDCLAVVEKARVEASNYLHNYGVAISVPELTSRLASSFHLCHAAQTQRSYGACVVIGDSKTVYALEPNGQFFGYFGCCFGKDASLARAELQRTKWGETSIEQALPIVRQVIKSLPTMTAPNAKYVTELLVIPAATGKPEFVGVA